MGTLSNITVDPLIVYWNDVNLGFTDGDIEISVEEQGAEITAHQEGTNVLDMIRTGKNVELGLTLKEASLSQLTTLINTGGSASTPVAEVTTVTCVADSAGSLNNKYFYIYSADDAIAYYVWYNVNSAGSDPAISGKTAVPVTLATGATAAQVATATAAALDALAAFVSTSSGAVVTVTNAATGPTTDATAQTSTFTVAVTTQGIGTLAAWGSSKDFTSMLSGSQKLVLHPQVLAATARTRDITFWKAYPMLSSIVHSGENPKTVQITFKIFPDLDRAAAIRLFALGDAH